MMGLMDNTKRLSMSFLMFKRKKRNKPMNILELFILAVGLSMDVQRIITGKDPEETYGNCRGVVWRLSGIDAIDRIFCRSFFC